jgi:hypothetical protein
MGYGNRGVEFTAARTVKATFPTKVLVIANKQHCRGAKTARGTFVNFGKVFSAGYYFYSLGLVIAGGGGKAAGL